MPLTIPVATVERVVDALLTRGHVPRGFLGVGMQPVRIPAAMAQRLELGRDRGVMITMIDPDTPAERAGLLLGDVVVAIDDEPVTDPEDVTAFLDADRVGKPLRLTIVRGGARSHITVTVGERPPRGRGGGRGDMIATLSAGGLLGPAIEEIAERRRRSTVRVHSRGGRGEGMGAGVIWSRHGRRRCAAA